MLQAVQRKDNISMRPIPRLVTTAAFAATAMMTLGAQAATASTSFDWEAGHGGGGSLINVSGNNVGPFQICNNDVPVNVLGVEVPADQLLGALGVLGDGAGNELNNVKNCDQFVVQSNGRRSGGGSLINVSGNNVGPFQICNNDVPVNVLGVEVPADQLLAALGVLGGSAENSLNNARGCKQARVDDGGDTPPGDTPPGDTPPGDTPPGDTPPGDTPPGDTPPGDTPPGDPALPDTGGSASALLALGILSVAGGAFLTIQGRRGIGSRVAP